MRFVLPLLLLMACRGAPQDHPARGEVAALPPEAQAAHQALMDALAEGEVDAISAAARAASDWQGADPRLDRDLGDALANYLLHPEAGAVLLRGNPLPSDEAWVRAARNAALRLGDRDWLMEMLSPPYPDAEAWRGLSLQHPVVDQVMVAARTDPRVDIDVLAEVLADCTLLDARPILGRRAVDLPAPRALRPVLTLFGATRMIVARTQLALRGVGPGETVWHCETGWLSDQLGEDIPDPLPPKGVLVAATDGAHAVWLEVENSRDGPWVTVASDADAAVRWVQAATLLDEELAAGATRAEAEAAVLARFGPGLVPAPSGPGEVE